MNAGAAKYAGWIFAPAAWALNTQLGQILPYADCGSGLASTALAAIFAFAVAACGAVISWRAQNLATSRMAVFISRAGILMASGIAFALVLQGAAALLVNPCER